MTEKDINKKLKEYYKKKWGIVKKLLICLFLMIICVIVNAVLSMLKLQGYEIKNHEIISNVSAAVGVCAYILLIVFIIKAASFPIGRYSLNRNMAKSDIVNILKYIGSMNCGLNEQYDNLMVLSRTTNNMVHDIHNWGQNPGSEEDCYNNAWNLLDRYFQENNNILSIDIENIKEYVNKLLLQLDNRLFDVNMLAEIMRRPSSSVSNSGKKSLKVKFKFRLNAETIICAICTITLLLIVVYKSIIFWEICTAPNRIIEFFLTIGSDIIAIVFAAFSLKACWHAEYKE